MQGYKFHKEMSFHGDSDIILEHVLKLVDVSSAIDVGCALGSWICSLKNLGVSDVKGLDGPWADKESLSKHIQLSDFVEHDLNSSVYTDNKRYDLAVCLEVAEHVRPEHADNVVDTLVGLSDVILWSAAIPKQGGDGHVNEQWPSYWQKKFEKYGYVFLDIVRPLIWNDKRIFKWYRQNTFVVVKEERAKEIMEMYNDLHIISQMIDVVHPEYYKHK